MLLQGQHVSQDEKHCSYLGDLHETHVHDERTLDTQQIKKQDASIWKEKDDVLSSTLSPQ